MAKRPRIFEDDEPTITTRGELREYARKFTREALDVIRACMKSEDNDPRVRILAADTLLDRGWGKAATVVEQADTPMAQLEEKKLAAEVALLEQKLLLGEAAAGDGISSDDEAMARTMRERFGEAETYDGGDETH